MFQEPFERPGNDRCDRNNLQERPILGGPSDGISDQNLLHCFVRKLLASPGKKQPVCGRDRQFWTSTCLEKRLNAGRKGASGRDHVIHDEAGLAADFADQMSDLGSCAALSSLVEDRDRSLQAVRIVSGHSKGARIRRDHDNPRRQFLVQDVAQRGNRRQAVHRNVKESLNLRRMEIHGDDMVDPDCLEHIGHHPPRNGLAPAMPLVRPCIPQVWHHRRDARSRSPPTGIRQGQQLDEMIVDGWRQWLHEKDFFSSDRLQQLNRSLSVRESLDRAGARKHSQIRGDRSRQIRVRCARKDDKFSWHVRRLSL